MERKDGERMPKNAEGERGFATRQEKTLKTGRRNEKKDLTKGEKLCII